MMKEKVPPKIVQAIYGANLTALEKKDGAVRPIAVGTTLRRLAAKIVSRGIRKPVGEVLRPVLLGCSTRGGCEGIVHIVRQFHNQQTGTPKSF